MRKQIIMLAVLLMPLSALAQSDASKRLELGARLGAGLMYVITDSGHDIYPSNGGFGGVLSFDLAYNLSGNLYIHSGLGLDYRLFLVYEEYDTGVDVDVLDADDAARYEGLTYEDASWNYYQAFVLEIPLLLQWRFPGILFVEAGALVDLQLASLSDGRMGSVYEDDDGRKKNINKIFDVSVVAGIGHKFTSGLSVDFRIAYQLTNLVDLDEYGVYVTENVIEVSSDGNTSISKINFDSFGSYYNLLKLQIGVGYWF